MKKIVSLLPAAFVVAASILAVQSCINKKYELSEENMDLNVHIFKEGLCLPLGSTVEIPLSDLLEKAGLGEDIDKFLNTDEEGRLSFYYASEEPLDLSDNLASLSGMLDIDKIDMSKEVDFSLDGVDVSGISYEGKTYQMKQSLTEMFSGYKITIPQIEENFVIDLTEGIDVNTEFAILSKTDFDAAPTFAALPDRFEVPDYYEDSMETPVTITEYNAVMRSLSKPEITMNADITTDPIAISFSQEFDKCVESVSDVHLKEGAKLEISVSVGDPFFTSGSIVPHVDIDFSKVFHLTDTDNNTVHDDHIDSDFILNPENNWTSSGIYSVESLVIEDGDWVKQKSATSDDVVLWLKRDMEIGITGTLRDDELHTTPKTLVDWMERHTTDHNVEVHVSMRLIDFEVDDVTMGFALEEPVVREDPFDITIPQMTFPKEVKTVEYVDFTDASVVTFNFDAGELNNILTISELEMIFPDKFEIEGADADNKVVFEDLPMTGGVSRQIKMNGIDVDDPDENGYVAQYKGEVAVKATVEVAGEIHTKYLKEARIKGDVDGDIEVGDYQVTVKGYELNQTDNPEMFQAEEVKIEIPEKLSTVEGLVVYLKDDPIIDITITMPETSFDIAPLAPDGLVIKFPGLMKFKEGGYAYEEWWDEDLHGLVFSAGEKFPAEIQMPIDHIVLNPVKDETDGKYYAKGDMIPYGAVGVPEDTRMTMEDVELMSQPDAEVSFKAIVPQLVPESVDVDVYNTEVEETIEFEPFKDVELPSMIKYVGNIDFDDVYLSLAVRTGDTFPSIGDGASLSFNAEVALPDFMVIDDPRYSEGKLTIGGQLVKESSSGNSLTLVVDPVKINSLDLDMTADQLKALKTDIAIKGGVTLSGASLNLDDWVGKTHVINVEAEIKTSGTDKLMIGEVTAKVDYSLDPVKVKVDMTQMADALNGDNLKVTLDLSTFYIALDLETNLGVQVGADLVIEPYFGEFRGKTINKVIDINDSPSSAQTANTLLWISDKAPESSGGYQYVDIDLLSLLFKDESKTQLADSLIVTLDAKTDAEELSIYEPSANYSLVLDYEAGIPMEFGENFVLEYRDTISDMPSELAQILAMGSLALGGEVESSLPLGLNLSVNLLDSSYGLLEMGEGAGKMNIASCDSFGESVVSQINLSLKAKEGVDYSDVKHLEIVFTADAKDAPDMPVMESNYVKVNRLYALIPEGLCADLNDPAFSKIDEEK